MRTKLTKTFTFESAHFLPCFPEGHKCRRLHGHSYQIDVIVEGEVDPDKGYLIDFGDIKKAFAPIEEELDHRLLNDIEGLENPTAENIAKWIFDRLQPELEMLYCIRVHETATSIAEYYGK